MKKPSSALSSYDPKHRETIRRPQNISWPRYDKPRLATPLIPEIMYTAEQYNAWASAVAALSEKYPVPGHNRRDRQKKKCRAVAVHFAKQGSRNEAFARAVYGGIPKAELRAVEALIFG